MDLFGTAGIRGNVVERVTPELAVAVGRAAGRPGDEFVVARDGRETGTALAAAMEAGLESAGADVRRVGMLPTPALAFASRGRRGAMLTASHNPPTDNGIKLFEDGEEYDRTAERAVESRVADDSPPRPWNEWGTSTREDVLDDYRDAVVEYTREHGAPLDGLRIAVDCGNGMGSLATPQVLRALGGNVVTLNANVDGHFPGRPSKPTPDTLTDLTSFVASDDFAFGLAHDGDADRLVLINGAGEIVHEDTVVAILAEHYVRESDSSDPVVVTTPNASARIDERVRGAGGRVERVRLGALHEGIASALEVGDEDTDVVFAAEPWKHVHTQFGGWIDGVVSAAVLARLVADVGGVESLRSEVTERPYRKVSVECPDAVKTGAMARLEKTIPSRFPDATVRTEYGVRAELPDGSWILVRPSGTEPYLRIYAESEDVDTLVAETEAVVEEAVSNPIQ
ncbi:phosphomannomutase [Haladaptatus sp. NG-WS-4]